MGNVIHLNGGYPFAVRPMDVAATGRNEDGHPLYEPAPSIGWSLLDSMAWMAGVTQLELGAPVEIRRSSMRSACTYLLQVGTLRPITALSSTRVLDILGGCLTAVALARGD